MTAELLYFLGWWTTSYQSLVRSAVYVLLYLFTYNFLPKFYHFVSQSSSRLSNPSERLNLVYPIPTLPQSQNQQGEASHKRCTSISSLCVYLSYLISPPTPSSHYFHPLLPRSTPFPTNQAPTPKSCSSLRLHSAVLARGSCLRYRVLHCASCSPAP